MEQETTKKQAESVVRTLGTMLQSQRDPAPGRFDQYIPERNQYGKRKCEHCGKDTYEGTQVGNVLCEECTKKLIQKKEPSVFLASCNVPPKFKTASFDNFTGGGIDGIRRLASRDEFPSTVLQGITGSGKTRIACQILRELCEAGKAWKKAYWFLSAYMFVLEMQDTFGKDDRKKLEIMNRYANYDLLVIDDIGFDDESKWSTGLFYALLDQRDLLGKPSIVTTNIKKESWKTELGARIESRLSSMEVFELPFGDYRKKR